MASKVFYVEMQVEDCACAITLNGAPLVDRRGRPPGSFSANMPVSEWVVSGDNTLGAQIVAVGDAPRLSARLREGQLGQDPNADADPILGQFELTVPDAPDSPLSPRAILDAGAPIELEAVAAAQHGWGQWYWETAPVFGNDRRSRQDLLDYLTAIHGTLSSGAIDPFLDTCRIKFSDIALCYGPALPAIRQEFGQAFNHIRGQPKFRLAPIDPRSVDFRVHCDHRVVEPVDRETGAPAIREHEDVGGLGWALPLMIGRLDAYRSDQLAIIR
ncbi:hypothetical protein PPSIR1_13710 [Plesiocystis pacifica SIR-1]|uniref:Uncharacterized protein n=1 Tax=Plesiocystis pacifica SIR-1 TaxID=391625 RepID=A6GJK0_9BACT|nr:hypothetical protein [Plesiocystis pacifica]EDM73958.1 hypothetical protein PPSIR1_13710 [Plesiocystis pacifica SIR-1]